MTTSPTSDRAAATSGTDGRVGPTGSAPPAAAPSPFEVMPLLCTHLTETAKQVESSVVTVCGNFHRIAQRVQESVARAQDVLGSQSNSEAGPSTRSIRKTSDAAAATLHHLLERITHGSESSMRAAAEMERLQRSMKGIEHVLDEVDRLASSTRFLALNASIEAARAGVHGQAFGVVAKEMAKMAVDSRRTSESIRGAVSGLIQEIGGISSQLTTRASSDLESAQTSREDVEAAMATLTATNRRLHESVAESARSSEVLAQEITASVMTLQFQDAVSQRIEHVVAALEEIGRSAADPARGGAMLADALRHLRDSYTMETERRVHAQHTGEPLEAAHSAAGSVELF